MRTVPGRAGQGCTPDSLGRDSLQEESFLLERNHYDVIGTFSAPRTQSFHPPGKLLSPSRRRQAVIRVLHVSERRACKALGQYRSTQKHPPRITSEEEQLTNRIVELAMNYERYGYRLITGLLRNEGGR